MRPTLNILHPDMINRIVEEALHILAEIGVEVRGRDLRQRLLDHGFQTDASGERLLFPPDVVRWAIEQAPSSFTLYDRDGRPHAEIGGDNVHFVPASSGLKVLDHRTGDTRLANTADFVEYIRVADGLEHIAYLATAFSTNDDIEPQVSDAWRLYLSLVNSKKPIVSGAFTEHGVPRMAEMMQLFRADKADLIARPMSIFTITATGNFRYSEDSCQNMIDCVEAGIPIEIVPVTLMGLIAPVTITGATVFHTADVLAGITMAQIIKPGAPVLFGGAPASFHMREATSPMLGIEALRLDMAYAAVGKHLGLPTQAYMALSDSKMLDAQAGAETFGSALLAALSSVNSVSGPGMLDFVLVFSLPKLIFDNEVCGQALQLVREIQLLEDLPTIGLARQLLAEQHLITAEHTLKYWPQELYLPSAVYDRSNREKWQSAPHQTLLGRATAMVEECLATYQGIATDPAIDAEMRRLIMAGCVSQTELPALPPLPPRRAPKEEGETRRRRRK
ncbi:MAG: trimethylamine methyltransferase family protein [Chloroflexi bacterium]|nr:trimethylamine methyltransferase family protein [Chloroflexota bacterium]